MTATREANPGRCGGRWRARGARGTRVPRGGIVAALVLVLTIGCWFPAAATVRDGGEPGDRAATAVQLRAMKDAAGPRDRLYQRNILIMHKGGKLALMVLGVVHQRGGPTLVVDPEGKVYRDGMDDFRRHNDLLTSDDTISFDRNLTSPDGTKADMVTMSGHTSPDRTPWFVGGGAALVLIGGGIAWYVVRHRRAEAEFAALR